MQEARWVGFFLRSSFLVFRGSTRLLRGFNGRRSFSVQWFMSVCPSEISRQTQCFYFHHSDRNPEQRSRGDCLNEDVSLFPAVLSESLLHASNVLSPSSNHCRLCCLMIFSCWRFICFLFVSIQLFFCTLTVWAVGVKRTVSPTLVFKLLLRCGSSM